MDTDGLFHEDILSLDYSDYGEDGWGREIGFCIITNETKKALYCDFLSWDGPKSQWVPRSHINPPWDNTFIAPYSSIGAKGTLCLCWWSKFFWRY